MHKLHFWWFDFQKALNRQVCYLCFMTSYFHMQYRKYILHVYTTRKQTQPAKRQQLVFSDPISNHVSFSSVHFLFIPFHSPSPYVLKYFCKLSRVTVLKAQHSSCTLCGKI
jgi:hypothetical protein